MINLYLRQIFMIHALIAVIWKPLVILLSRATWFLYDCSSNDIQLNNLSVAYPLSHKIPVFSYQKSIKLCLEQLTDCVLYTLREHILSSQLIPTEITWNRSRFANYWTYLIYSCLGVGFGGQRKDILLLLYIEYTE